MRFVNLNGWPLDFMIDGHRFHVPMDGEVDLPEPFCGEVKARGILLVPAADVEPAPAPVVEKPKRGK